MKTTNPVKKKDLIFAVANELYQFNVLNKKYAVSDKFTVDGKEYSIRAEVFAYLKRKGYTQLLKLMEYTTK